MPFRFILVVWHTGFELFLGHKKSKLKSLDKLYVPLNPGGGSIRVDGGRSYYAPQKFIKIFQNLFKVLVVSIVS
jgi:hypothetical protein